MKETLLIAANGTKEEKISLFKMRLALSLPLRDILSVVVTSRVIYDRSTSCRGLVCDRI